MTALPQIDLETSITRLTDAALRIKAERDQMEAALRSIAKGCDIMLADPPLAFGHVKVLRAGGPAGGAGRAG